MQNVSPRTAKFYLKQISNTGNFISARMQPPRYVAIFILIADEV